MAWNVVIAGGGFGGRDGGAGAGADDAEAVGAADPRQRRQLHALHAVPAGGGGRDAGAAPRGHAAARDPQAHLPAARARSSAHDPERAHGRAADQATATVEQLPYDQLLLALGSVSRVLPVPGLAEHAIGFKSLADAIWLRNHVIETLEAANATDDPAPPRRAAHLRLRRRRLRRPRGARRAAGLRRRRDRELPARPPARDALGPGRGDRPRPAGDRRRARRLRAARAARPRHRHPPRHDAGGGRPPTAPGSRPARRCRPGPSSGPPASPRTRACATSACRSTSAAGSRSTTTCGCRGMDSVWAIGDCAAAPDPRGGTCPPTAQHAVRQGPVAARNIAAELGIGTPRPFELPRQRRLRQPRPLQGGRQGRRPHLPRLPGLVDGAHLPHEPDPGHRAQGARGDRLDREPALPAATSPRSARSATRSASASRHPTIKSSVCMPCSSWVGRLHQSR